MTKAADEQADKEQRLFADDMKNGPVDDRLSCAEADMPKLLGQAHDEETEPKVTLPVEPVTHAGLAVTPSQETEPAVQSDGQTADGGENLIVASQEVIDNDHDKTLGDNDDDDCCSVISQSSLKQPLGGAAVATAHAQLKSEMTMPASHVVVGVEENVTSLSVGWDSSSDIDVSTATNCVSLLGVVDAKQGEKLHLENHLYCRNKIPLLTFLKDVFQCYRVK